MITIRKAHEASHIPEKVFLEAASRGFIQSEPSLFGMDISDTESLAPRTKVPLSCLPEHTVMTLRKSRSAEYTFDFLSYFLLNGWKKTNQLAENISLMRQVICSKDFSSSPKALFHSHLENLGISPSTFYKERNTMYTLGLLEKIPTPKKHPSICPLAANIIEEHCFYHNKYADQEILDDLSLKAQDLGCNVCSHCPFNPATEVHQKAFSDIERLYPSYVLPVCHSAGTGLLYPSDPSTINRFIRDLSPSVIHFGQNEFKDWRAKYGYKVRRYAEHVNDVWFCDFVCLDVLLFKELDEEGNPVLEKPWACIISDAASSMIVSSLVRFGEPTVEDVIYCFCIGAVHKLNNCSFGLPLVLYTDNAGQFRPKPGKKRKQLKLHRLSNKAVGFFEQGFLNALGVTLRTQQSNCPWEKPIETINRILQYKYLKRVPGWTGGKKHRKHKARIESEMKRLIKNHAFWDMEKFQSFWFEYLIPAYNNHGNDTPVMKYERLPRANTLTPSWATISILAEKKTKVHIQQGSIRYLYSEFSSPELLRHEGKTVWIYDFGCMATGCISVFSAEKNHPHFLGLAYEKEIIRSIEPNRLALMRALSLRHLQTRITSHEVNAVTYLSEMMGLARQTYIDYRDHQLIPTHYTDKVDHLNTDRVHLNEEFLKAKIAEEEVILSTLKNELSNSHSNYPEQAV